MVNPIPGPGGPIIPGPDADAVLWMLGFAAAWDETNFGASSPDAAALSSAAGDFESALQVASDPATRTSTTIALKRAARDVAEVLFRQAAGLARTAYLAGDVDGSMLTQLGLRIPDTTRTSVNPPAFAPIAGAVSAAVGVCLVQFTQVDWSTGEEVSTRGFARYCAGIQMQRKAGSGEWTDRGIRKRLKHPDDTSELALGTVVQYRGRYVMLNGSTGPWSSVVSGAVL